MITVAVCTHNRAGRLSETLEPMLRMEVPGWLDWELLVVDNGSTDDTRRAVRRFAATSDGRVRYFWEPRLGLSRARNAAVGAARGEIVAFTDDDVIPEANWLAALAEAFRDHDCAGAGGRVLARWEFEPPDWWEATAHELDAAIVSFDPGGGPRELDMAPFGANMAFRREMFDRHGGFRTDLGRRGSQLMSGEDTEFGRRLLEAGERIRYVPEATVHHPVSRERATKAYFRRWYFEFGRTVVRRDGLPAAAPRILGIPRYLFRELCAELLKAAGRWSTHRRFVHELRARSILGKIVESRRGDLSVDVTTRPGVREANRETRDPRGGKPSDG